MMGRAIGAACGVNLSFRPRVLVVLMAAAAAGVAAPAGAQIYAGTSGSGAVVLSNFQTSETPDVVIAATLAAPVPAVAADLNRPNATVAPAGTSNVIALVFAAIPADDAPHVMALRA